MPAIRHQVWINAPRRAVYELIASADGVSRWWDPQTEVRTADGVY